MIIAAGTWHVCSSSTFRSSSTCRPVELHRPHQHDAGESVQHVFSAGLPSPVSTMWSGGAGLGAGLRAGGGAAGQIQSHVVMQWQQHMHQEAAADIAGLPSICGGAERVESGITDRQQGQLGSLARGEGHSHIRCSGMTIKMQMQRRLATQLSSECFAVTQACSLRMTVSQGHDTTCPKDRMFLRYGQQLDIRRPSIQAASLTWEATQLRFYRCLASSLEVDGKGPARTE